MDNSKCVILVPVGDHVEPECERGLKELEARGYAVRRVTGYAAIDQGRSQMATDALADGFAELMWIDSDIGFDADAVDRLRAYDIPIVCGIYPKKGPRALACHLLPSTRQVVFGEGGGLLEIAYAATGFLLTRRAVYETMAEKLELPICNIRFARPIVPYFLPLIAPDGDGHWYLGEDYAFCERAKRSGFKIFADTQIRLRHIGRYGFSWEDAGAQLPRFAQFNFHVQGPSDKPELAPEPESRIPFDACPLCSHRSATEVRVADCTHHPLYRRELPPTQHWVACDACGHLFTDGCWDARVRASFASPRPLERASASRIIAAVSRFATRPLGRWLDAGGSGALTTTAAELGYEVVALDPRPARVAQLKQYGLQAHGSELAELAAAEPFEIVSLAGALERTPKPRAALTRAHTLLRDGGLLFVSAANIDSIEWETLDEANRNPHWGELEALHRFSRSRLEALLRECGFSPCHIAASEDSVAGIEIIARKVRSTQ